MRRAERPGAVTDRQIPMSCRLLHYHQRTDGGLNNVKWILARPLQHISFKYI
jgi:hypothetical protein